MHTIPVLKKYDSSGHFCSATYLIRHMSLIQGHFLMDDGAVDDDALHVGLLHLWLSIKQWSSVSLPRP